MNSPVASVPYAEVIGDPIAHSKSPAIHNFWLGKLGIVGEYRACHVRPDQLPDYFTNRRDDTAWRGCNVTMPHKEAVLPFLDGISDGGRFLNAANTITRDAQGQLHGTNTDVEGVAEPLRKLRIADQPGNAAPCVQIIGAGGAARAAAIGATEAGYEEFQIFNRSVGKADALAAMIGGSSGKGHSLDELGPVRNFDERRRSHVIINATSMGMYGENPVPIDLSRYFPDTIVFDMVYAPLDTPLLKQARELGLQTIDGLEMLVGQAATAFELFFGQAPPRQHDPELREILTS